MNNHNLPASKLIANNLLAIISDINIQDMIIDVEKLTIKFNKYISQYENLHIKQQALMAKALQGSLKTNIVQQTNWQNLQDIKDYFNYCIKQKKLERAKDAGVKMLSIIQRVMNLDANSLHTIPEINYKFANNHEKHTQDVFQYGSNEDKNAFNKEIQEISTGLKSYTNDLNKKIPKSAPPNTVTLNDEALINKYNNKIKELNDEYQLQLNGIKEQINNFAKTLEKYDIQKETEKETTQLNTIFNRLISEKQKLLKLNSQLTEDFNKAKSDIEQEYKVKLEQENAKKLGGSFKAKLVTFLESSDQATQDQGFIDNINKLFNDLNLNTLTIKPQYFNKFMEPIQGIEKKELDTTLNSIQSSNNLVKLKKTIADAYHSKKKERAKSAGKEINQIFNEVINVNDSTKLKDLTEQYNKNHNAHALNLLECTTPNDPLREVMFKEIDKLPFPREITRDLDKLKIMFEQLVNSKQKKYLLKFSKIRG